MQQIKTLPKLSKLTKTAKIQFIKDALKEGNFDRDEIATSLDIKDRQVRRYLNEIAQEDAELNPGGTQILRNICLANLTKKAALGKLSTTIEVGIVLAGESKKLEVKEQSIESKTVTYNLNYTEEDKNAIIAARRAILNRRSSPPEPISLH